MSDERNPSPPFPSFEGLEAPCPIQPSVLVVRCVDCRRVIPGDVFSRCMACDRRMRGPGAR